MAGTRSHATQSPEHSPSARAKRFVTRVLADWWPAVAIVAAVILLQEVTLNERYDVGGHAGEHLVGASAPYLAGGVLGVALWARPQLRRAPEALLAGFAWWATTVLVMLGNLWVVDDLLAAGHAYTPTSAVPDVADHSLANAAPWYGVVASLVLVWVWHRRDLIGSRVAICAAVASILVPPWIIPGAGALVACIAAIFGRSRAARRDDMDREPVGLIE